MCGSERLVNQALSSTNTQIVLLSLLAWGSSEDGTEQDFGDWGKAYDRSYAVVGSQVRTETGWTVMWHLREISVWHEIKYVLYLLLVWSSKRRWCISSKKQEN